MLSLIDKAPKELAGDIALIDGVLYCSDARRGDPLFMSFSSFAKRLGVTDHKFVAAEKFKSEYSGANPGALQSMSDTQGYAKSLINEAYKKNATDIHIAHYGSYGIIKFRSLGMLKDYAKLPGKRTRELIGTMYNTLSTSTNTVTFTETVRQDSRIVDRKYLPKEVHSIRVHTEPLECDQAEDGTGIFMALRLLHDRTEAKGGLEERLTVLGYGDKDIPKFEQLTERTGLTIISGPTGHGKSTLLKHLMDSQALKNPEKNYMSIEDPPEYPLFGVHQIKVSTNVDADADPAKRAREYTNAIAGAMRSDPDVLMIGEIRYPEAAKASINSALSGHGTFATLHANNALGIILRMEALLSEAGYANPLEYLCDHNVLAGLIYQRLVPVLCPHCKIPLTTLLNAKGEDAKHKADVLPKHTESRLTRVMKHGLDSVYIRGRGCEKCDNLGIASQTVASEIIVTDEVFLRHVRQGNSDKAYDYWLKSQENQTYIQHAIEGISEGRLDPYLTELRLGVPLNFVRSAGEKA